MKQKTSKIKRVLVLCLIFLLSINSFAALVSDNDGSAFVTKAEFDALKNSFAEQINNYNISIDNKIDGAIASYLAGIQLSTMEELKLDPNLKLEFPVYSCVGKESNKHTYKESSDPRFDLSLPHIEHQSGGIHNTTNGAAGSGLRAIVGKSSGYNPNGTNAGIVGLWYEVTHADPVTGKYEVAAWDAGAGIWRTKGYKKGYIKSGDEYKVQDLTVSTKTNDYSASGQYSLINSNFSTGYKRFYYPCLLGSNERNLNNTTDTTDLEDWFGDATWHGAQANWYNVNNTIVNANQKKLMENWDGKNLTLTDLKTMCINAGGALAGASDSDCKQNLSTSAVKSRIESDSKRNKIYSGANAYVNAYPESNIWKYKPVRIGGKWKSDNYTMMTKRTYMFTTHNASSTWGGYGLSPFQPWYPKLVPALDGDTSDETFASDAKFSIINADKLYWTDINGEDHKFNEGLFITKLSKNGSMQGAMKFSEASDEKVWCAFSKKPFDGSWTVDDAITITANGTKKTKTDLLYDCNTVYTFKIDNLLKNEKIYMCFKSSSGTKNPALDRFDNLILMLED